MPERKGPRVNFVRPSVVFAAGLAILLLIRFTLRVLPILMRSIIIAPEPGEAGFAFTLPYAVIAVAIVDTLILVLLINFGRQIGCTLRLKYKLSRDIVKTTTLLAFLLALFIAYKAYGLLGYAVLRDRALYELVFLCFTALALIAASALGYRNWRSVTDLIMGKLPRETKSLVCPDCAAHLRSGAKFCRECGTDIRQQEVLPTVQARSCPRCGRGVNATARFCSECGASFDVHPSGS